MKKTLTKLVSYQQSRYLIGIDVGTNTGVAIWDRAEKKFLFVKTLTLHLAFDKIKEFSLQYKGQVTVFVENPNTFIPFKQNGSKENIAKINAKKQGAGSVKRDFSAWVELLEYYKIPYIPTKVQGSIKKMTAIDFKNMTKFSEQTSEHARDAAMIIFGR